ncbi:PP2C family protein-serine/threonine phosphatase [Nocardioides fonticola]|uniref:PP2C family protein-serine/threonine phosphatase n=1 Tax=Nocardioides fonticola TaxID=450363 RepID=A0ABP7XUR4_9ACTN
MLAFMLLGVTVCLAVSLPFYSVLPVSTYFLWLLVGMLLLRYVPLMILTVYTVVGAIGIGVYDGLHDGTFGSARLSGMIALVVGGLLALHHARGQRTGLPTPLGEAMLADLRERLQAQGRIPPLPAPWYTQTAMIAAHDVGYAGDFMMAAVDDEGTTPVLEVILVDVVGKGVAAGVDALQFAGALGGLIGAMPPRRLMEAANDFLLRQPAEETFATAAYVRLELDSGRYLVLSAGHPPALRWDHAQGAWLVDNARGLALGIHRHPELEASEGKLAPGEALLFYTDGVVESRGGDIEEGIAWLQEVARRAVAPGFEGAARRIVRQVSRGDDDRAVFLVSR